MPNHVTNRVTIDGTKAQVKKVLAAIKSKDRAIDFEKIIPMPKRIYRGNLGQAEEQKFGRENCWYEWSISNWGTKWNAYDTSVEGNTVIFDTAWSAPKPILEELSLMFPEVSFYHEYADEDIGSNCGAGTFQNREYIPEIEFDSYSKDSARFALGVKGWDADEYFSEMEEE